MYRGAPSFVTSLSAPPVTTTTSSSTTNRMMSNNAFNRTTTTMNSNQQQQTASRLKSTYDSRRYSNIQSTFKRPTQPTLTSNPKNVPPLARIEISSHPSARLVLQQQISSPGRLQQQSIPTSPMVVPSGSILDPLVIGRTRQVPLPPAPPSATIRNAIHRNAVSLNTLSTTQPNGLTSARGRSQNSAYKTSLTNRTTRLRHQSSAPYDLQQQPAHSSMPYATTTVIYRHPLNTDSPPVFFE